MDKEERKKRIGKRLRNAREEKGLSQAELAELMGKYSSAISNYETGATMMHITELPEFARVLGVSVAYFFDESVPKDLEQQLVELLDKLKPNNREIALKNILTVVERHLEQQEVGEKLSEIQIRSKQDVADILSAINKSGVTLSDEEIKQIYKRQDEEE